MRFADVKEGGARWITSFESEYYPDYLEKAIELYQPHLERFRELVAQATSASDLLTQIANESQVSRIQLLRIFRKYVSPVTSVEMLKVKRNLPQIIEDFGHYFRDIHEVRTRLADRPEADEAIIAILNEYADRGSKGYELTERFFLWFDETFGADYVIDGPQRAGRDVMLEEKLDGFPGRLPADFLISRQDGTPLAVGFARYDSDRGGAQEDDRTGGNRDKVMTIMGYAREQGVPLKIVFLNDGPGLLLGSMWRDYAAIEDIEGGNVLVTTLKMLDVRFTREWLESDPPDPPEVLPMLPSEQE